MDATELTLALLATRARGATICPSEVARAMAAAAAAAPSVVDWRDKMPEVHAAIDRLVAQELVRLSWKGRHLTTRAGPYRIGRSTRDER